MPFPLSKIGCIASAAKLDGYAATIEGLPGGPPLAHWGLGEVGGTEIRDRKETRHGTYSGTIGYGAAGLPQGSSNAAIDFGAVGHGTVAHDSGLLLSAFTLSFWFQQHGLPHVEIGSLMPILTKDTSANTTGDFSIFVDTEGDLIVRMQDGAANHTLGAPISLGTTYHLAVRVDNTGFDAYLNGEYLGKNTNVTSAWSGNTQDLRFAFAPFLAYQEGDCILDEVALYSRVLAEAEVLILAQQAEPPTAVGDAASIPESATTTIDVTANDTFVGSKAGLTVQIMSQPGGGDSVAVNANKDIAYTAGAVGANTARSFSYRITDPLGVSNTAAVNLTVLDSDAPASDQANCYTENTVDTVVVTTMAALESEVNAAPPGRTILIRAGTYDGGSRTFNRAGTANNPIVIRPESGLGTVTINDGNWTLPATSARLVISKLYFVRSNININGSHNRVTRCRFREIDTKGISVSAATDTRIDHNDFAGYVADITTRKHCIEMSDNAAVAGTLRRILIDYNYIHDFPAPSEPLGQVTDCAFIYGGDASAWNIDYGRIEDHNLYLNAHSRTGEFVNIKCSGAKVRYCTFVNVHAYLQQRAGGGGELRSCWFESMGSSAPVKWADEWASGAGPALVIGNRVVNQDIWVMAGGDGGDDTHSTNPYPSHRARELQCIGNICRNLYVGGWWSSSTPVYPALNCNLWNNTGTRVDSLEVGTTTLNPATNTFANLPKNPSVTPWYDYSPAVKIPTPTLTTSDQVGMFAPDPLCPSGPQS